MKTINNFIVEHLEYSTFPINEKLKISSKSNIYTCQPKDEIELRKILEERLEKDENADLNDIDVSQITDMAYHDSITDMWGLFYGLDPHNIDISQWDVSKVENMEYMFYDCRNFNCDLSKWDVKNVKNMERMFRGCFTFNCDLNNWDVSIYCNTYFMFSECTSLINKPSWYKK